MIATLASWWRIRTPRERLLLSAALALALGVLAPLAIMQAAIGFRADAGRDRAAAEALLADVRRVQEAGAATPASVYAAMTPEEAAQAVAQAVAAPIAGLEPAGPGRVRVRFTQVEPLAVTRWLDELTRNGFAAPVVQMTRSGDGGRIDAMVELAAGATP